MSSQVIRFSPQARTGGSCSGSRAARRTAAAAARLTVIVIVVVSMMPLEDALSLPQRRRQILALRRSVPDLPEGALHHELDVVRIPARMPLGLDEPLGRREHLPLEVLPLTLARGSDEHLRDVLAELVRVALAAQAVDEERAEDVEDLLELASDRAFSDELVPERAQARQRRAAQRAGDLGGERRHRAHRLDEDLDVALLVDGHREHLDP